MSTNRPLVACATSILALGACVSLASPAQAAGIPAGAKGFSQSKSAAYTAYQTIYKPALSARVSWTGATPSCRTGAPSAATQTATLRMVNYYRQSVGLKPVSFNATYNAKAQSAALMMAANNQLSHAPSTTWRCSTAAGRDGAAHSNLFLGASGATAIAGYMDDTGVDSLGHRRWILHAPLTAMGSGSTANSNALYVLTDRVFSPAPTGTPALVPWPAAGFVPKQIAPSDLWSVSSTSNLDMSKATVSVKRNGVAQRVSVVHPANNYGANAVAFRFVNKAVLSQDAVYAATVTGIRSSTGQILPAKSYTTVLFNAEVKP